MILTKIIKVTFKGRNKRNEESFDLIKCMADGYEEIGELVNRCKKGVKRKRLHLLKRRKKK